MLEIFFCLNWIWQNWQKLLSKRASIHIKICKDLDFLWATCCIFLGIESRIELPIFLSDVTKSPNSSLADLSKGPSLAFQSFFSA